MNGLNFSSQGRRWRVVVITRDMAASAYVPPLPGAGLLFSSDDGSFRFISLDADAVPTIDELRSKSNQELGALVQRASGLAG